jgi:ubiquinone/menaquinone biosynthesis C-methylase UbiE
MTLVNEGFPYLHGTHPDEQERLSGLNRLLNEESLRALVLREGDRVLDVGCGLGQLTRAMARAVGTRGRVVGVDASADQLAEAGEQAAREGETDLVDLRRGDAVDLPLTDDERGRFDVAHTRFLLEHVPDPLAVVRSMVRAVRPGGRVVLQDDDHDTLRLWPESPGFDALWRAYIAAFERMGMDPYVGRHLIALLHQAGAHPARNDCLFFGGCAGNPTFVPMVANFVGILRGARPTIVSRRLMPADGFDDALAAFERWSRRPDAAMWYTAAWAEGRRPQR